MKDSSNKSKKDKNLSLREFSFKFEKFGTRINLSIISHEDLECGEIFSVAEGIYEKYDRIFNRFDQGSEISKLNESIGSFNKASEEIIEVIEKSLFFHNETDGYFDPRIVEFLEEAGYREDFSKMPKIQNSAGAVIHKIEKPFEEDLKIEKGKVFFGRKMDFSGIVKGLVNDKVKEYFSSKGLESFMVDSGGDMFFLGKDVRGEKWTVDIEGVPSEKLILEISGEGIATSGIAKRKWEMEGKRKHHLINPKNHHDFRFDLKTVTVIESSTEKADVWAKTLFLMGKEKGIEYSKKKKIKSFFLDYAGSAWISPEMEKYRI